MEKLAIIDALSANIVELFPGCVNQLTSRGQAYLALDMPLNAYFDGQMGATLNVANLASHILEIESLISMLKFEEAREKVLWMKSWPFKKFQDALRNSRVEEKIARKEEELLEVTTLNYISIDI